MKLTLKIVVALAVFTAVGTAYAEIPDVSKWFCSDIVFKYDAHYGLESMFCDNNEYEDGNFYISSISGKLIYIHERRTDAGKTVYYNALKTGDRWFEIVNERYLTFQSREVENKGILLFITDDNNKLIAKRIIPLFKK